MESGKINSGGNFQYLNAVGGSSASPDEAPTPEGPPFARTSSAPPPPRSTRFETAERWEKLTEPEREAIRREDAQVWEALKSNVPNHGARSIGEEVLHNNIILEQVLTNLDTRDRVNLGGLLPPDVQAASKQLRQANAVLEVVNGAMDGFFASARRFGRFGLSDGRIAVVLVVGKLREALELDPLTVDSLVLAKFLNHIQEMHASPVFAEDMQLKAMKLARGLISSGALMGQVAPDITSLVQAACTLTLNVSAAPHVHTSAGYGAMVKRTMDFYFGEPKLLLAAPLTWIPATIELSAKAIQMASRENKSSSKALKITREAVYQLPRRRSSDDVMQSLTQVLLQYPTAKSEGLKKLYEAVENKATPTQKATIDAALDAANRSWLHT